MRNWEKPTDHQDIPFRNCKSTSNLDTRLETWKEIASYLKRNVRTAQRWERFEGLPVHRILHSKFATAYAFKSEIDAWLDSRRNAWLAGIQLTVARRAVKQAVRNHEAEPSKRVREALLSVAARELRGLVHFMEMAESERLIALVDAAEMAGDRSCANWHLIDLRTIVKDAVEVVFYAANLRGIQVVLAGNDLTPVPMRGSPEFLKWAFAIVLSISTQVSRTRSTISVRLERHDEFAVVRIELAETLADELPESLQLELSTAKELFESHFGNLSSAWTSEAHAAVFSCAVPTCNDEAAKPDAEASGPAQSEIELCAEL